MTRKTTKNNDSLLGMVFILALVFLLNWAVRNQQIALTLAQQPELILPYLVEQFGWLRLILATIFIMGAMRKSWLAIANTQERSPSEENHSIIP